MIHADEFAYINWLNQEDENDIRLINLPMGRSKTKRYMLHLALNGYPHAEGAISRTPDAAFDYIRANAILGSWNSHTAISCEIDSRDLYLSALERLETDGFSHVVFHRLRRYGDKIVDSFRTAKPSYHDDYVSIYRLEDLRDSCAA